MGKAYVEGDKPLPGYQLVRFLGRGGFGQVWKAIGPGGIEVALKIIDLQGSAGIKEFRGIRLFKQIRHPNLAPITAFWLKDEAGNLVGESDSPDGNTSTMIMSRAKELLIIMGLGDKNLLDRLKECQAEGKMGIPPDELLDYMEESAKAIDYLNSPRHDLGSGPVAIQHCDIKPQNILIVGGSAQVCDFGLARALSDSRTTAASVSAAYAAPEVLTSNQPSRFTDQYSLAISYIELRTGNLPFNTSFPASILYAHLQGKLDLSQLTPEEQIVIRKATAPNPEDRYPTCLDMVKALKQAFAPKTTPAMEPTPKVKYGGRAGVGVELVPGYKLIKLLGKGSFGEVWEATAPGGKHVALKIIRNLDAPAGKQEFKALETIKGIDHNNLMELHAYWLIDREGQIITDEMREKPQAPQAATLVIAGKLAKMHLGQRLRECQEKTGKGIPVSELLRYIRESAEAIDFLNTPQHRMGDKIVAIQHRDIKPENILLAEGGAKVADFGLAKVLEDTSAIVHSESAGLTMAYAAPELFRGRVTQWTDQYALAITYYQLRTGVLPFSGVTSANDVVQIHVQGRLVFDRVPPPEAEVLHRATSLVPENRFPSCMEFYRSIYDACAAEDVLDEPGLDAPPGSSGQLSRRPSSSSSGAGLGKRSSSTSSIPKASSRPTSLDKTMAGFEEDEAYGGTRPGYGGDQPTVPVHPEAPHRASTKATVRSDHVEDSSATIRVASQTPSATKGKVAERKAWQDERPGGRDYRPPPKPSMAPWIILMSLLAMAGFGVGAWWYLKKYPPGEDLETWIVKRIDQNQWTEALKRLEGEQDISDDKRTELKQKIGQSWLSSLKKKYADVQGKADLEEVAAQGKEFLGYFPDESNVSDIVEAARKRIGELVAMANGTKPTQATQTTKPTVPIDTPPEQDRTLERFRVVVANLGPAFDWPTHADHCQELIKKYPQVSWLKLALAEALMEKSSEAEPFSAQQVRDLLQQAGQPSEEKAYAIYVRAVLDSKNRARRLSAEKIMDVAPTDAFLQSSEHRKTRAVAILLEAAMVLRVIPEKFRHPFAGDEEAQLAWKWLQQARNFLPDARWQAKEELTELLAAEETKQPAQIMTALLKGISNRLDLQEKLSPMERYEVYCLRLKYPPATLQELLQTTAMVEQLLAALKSDLSYLDLADQYHLVFEPALKIEQVIGEQESSIPEAELTSYRNRMAKMHDALGLMILENLYTPMPMFEGKHKERAVQAFTRAIELQPKTADFYIHRASALSKLNRVEDLPTILKDGETARELDDQLPGSHGWIAYALHHQARSQLDLPKKEQQLRDVLKGYDQAILKSSQDERYKTEWTSWKVSRSSAYVELANSMTEKNLQRLRTLRGDVLQKAIIDAQEAIQSQPKYPELAYEALGNAHEDMAMFTGQVQHYQLADQAFDQAIRARRDLPHSYVARGRCLYRAIMDEAVPRTQFPLAINYLNQALNKGNDTVYGAESRFWLGKIYFEQEQHQRAEDEFKASLEAFKKLGRIDWVAACYQTLALNAARVAGASRAGSQDPLGTQGFAKARGYVDSLDQIHSPLSKDLLISIMKIEAQTSANAGFFAQNQRKTELADQAYQRALSIAKELQDLGEKAQSAIIEIEVLNYKGQLQEALDLTTKKLPRSLEAVKPEELELLLKRAELMLLVKDKKDLPSSKAIDLLDIRNILVRCEQLLDADQHDAKLVAILYGRIGEFYYRMIIQLPLVPTNPEEERLKRSFGDKAISFLKKALGLHPKHIESYAWRAALADIYSELDIHPVKDLSKLSSGQRKELMEKCEEAIKLLSEVQADPIFKRMTEGFRRQISDSKDKLEKRLKEIQALGST